MEERGAARVVMLNGADAYGAADAMHDRRLARIWTGRAAEDEVRAVVPTGAGDASSGGGDLDLLRRIASDAGLRAEVVVEAAGREASERRYEAFLRSRTLTIPGGSSETIRRSIRRRLLALPRA